MEPDKRNMGSPYRNVIFDLDGTLIDSRPGILAGIRHALAQLGHELPSNIPLDWAIGPPLEEVMARLLEPFGDNRIGQAVSHYHDHYGGVGLFFARPYEGISRLLGGMRNRGAVALCRDVQTRTLGHDGAGTLLSRRTLRRHLRRGG